jgi:Fibronectin type III domain/Subtilase family
MAHARPRGHRAVAHVAAIVLLTAGVAAGAVGAGAAPPVASRDELAAVSDGKPDAPGSFHSKIGVGLGLDAALPAGSALTGSMQPAEMVAPTAPGSDRIAVAVHLDPSSDGAVRAAVEATGGTIAYDAGATLFVDIDRAGHGVADIAAIDAVTLVEADPVAESAAGPVTTEGVATIGAAPWHAAGVTGAGIDVAIVDGGFAGYQSRQAAGDLPAGAQLVARNHCASFESTTHGTAVAEIVHDVAPGARLHLICVGTLSGLLQAKDYILDPANGIDVVQHSVGWYGTSRGGNRDDDGDGAVDTPAEVVAAVRDAGILWVNAAGNEAQEHWSGGWADTNNDDFLDGFPGGIVSKGAAGTLGVWLRWDDWPGAAPDSTPTDLDLYLFCGSTLVAWSELIQNGTQPPVELLAVTGSCPTSITLAVRDSRGTAVPGLRLDIWLVGDATSGLSQPVAAGSLAEPASQVAATAVGAVNVSSGLLAPYSSRGPNLDGSAKPFLSAPDCVSGTSYGPRTAAAASGFCGTSASAPHVSGAAALLLHANPTLRANPAALEQALAARAVPHGAPASDVGWGVVHMGAVPTAVVTIPGPPTNVTAVATQSPIGATVSWTAPANGGSAITGYRVHALPSGQTVDVGGAATSAAVSGLTPGATYTFTVTASNALGWGQASTPTAAVVVPSAPSQPAAASTPAGYWMLATDGTVYPFGQARSYGDVWSLVATLGRADGNRAVDLERTTTGNGYVIALESGHVSSFGDSPIMSNLPVTRRLTLRSGEWVTSLSLTPTGQGVWLFTNRGQVATSGDAPFYGDLSGLTLNGPVLDSIPTPSGHGYYMVASDGGIFAFGDAAFYGSMGGRSINAPVQSLVPTATGAGYWLVAADGGIFAFGDAGFVGAIPGVLAPGQRLNKPITGMIRYGSGYLMVGEDGGIFSFSDRPFLGSLGNTPPATPIVAVAQLG